MTREHKHTHTQHIQTHKSRSFGTVVNPIDVSGLSTNKYSFSAIRSHCLTGSLGNGLLEGLLFPNVKLRHCHGKKHYHPDSAFAVQIAIHCRDTARSARQGFWKDELDGVCFWPVPLVS